MSEPTNPIKQSRRRMARQRRITARIGGQFSGMAGDLEKNPMDAEDTGAELMDAVDDAPDAPIRLEERDDSYTGWEDTSTLLKVSEQKAFWGKQPPLFWIAAATLLVALCAVIAVIGVERWHEAELARQEARRLQALEEEKAKYKFLYRDLIEKYADQNNVDPALIAAIIYHESRFDPQAVSNVGARGLMQIMEDTGSWIAGKLGESSNFTVDSLFVPETSIRFGAWYVSYLSNRFGGDIVKIAAGYHAGQSKVAGWLQNAEYSHDGWTLDVIPIPETDQYVKRVVNAYEIYKKHYYAPAEEASVANT